jgi:hypothetical protein
MALNFPVDPVSGQLHEGFRWDSGIGAWQVYSPLTLNELGDVTSLSPVSGDLLSYNGTEWVNASQEELNVGDADLGALFWMYA